MLPIFTNGFGSRGSISSLPSLPNFQRLSQLSVAQQQEYYASNVRKVDTDHPLVQLISHMPSWTTDTVELYDTASARYPYLSRNLKFTTDYNPGTFKGHKVYNREDNMIYATYDYVSPYTALANWKDLKPVKVIWLDTNQIDLSVPDSHRKEVEGLAAISVDVPLLTMMYKGYKASEAIRTNGNLVLGPNHFVATHVLPSMINSQLDASCISSLIAIYRGDYESYSRVESSIYIPTRGTEFKDIAKHCLKRIEGTRMQYIHMLQHMPTVFTPSAWAALQLPDFVPTTQVEWAMMVSRLKIIEFLIDVGGKPGQDANRGFINQLKTYCRDVQMSKIPYRDMSDNLATYVDDTLIKLKRLK